MLAHFYIAVYILDITPCESFLLAQNGWLVFLTCNTKNIIYLIALKCCGKQYIDSGTGFKESF